MPTYNGYPFSSTRNLNVKGGLIRFGRTYTSNPFASTDYGIYLNTAGNLVFSRLGVITTFTITSASPSRSPSVSPSVSPS